MSAGKQMRVARISSLFLIKFVRSHVACSTNEGNPEGKRPLGRPRRRWVDNIKMELGEIGWDGMDWIHLAQDRDQWRALVNTVMNLQVS
jgi:hypothetical protein